ncbi:amino acid adenylation domain-containing protein [Nonomuraea antimicrobica]
MGTPSSREDRIAALPASLRDQLRRRLAGAAEAADEIRPAPRDGVLPLSPAQQRLWFLDDYEPGGIDYNTSIALRLSGPLDVPALAAAVNGVVARHESLRTTFDSADGSGVQIVHNELRLALPVVEGSSQDLDHLVRTEIERPFDLKAGPLFRALLVRTGAEEHLLVLSAHHIVIDGWSMGVVLGDLAALYGAALLGEPPSLPDLPLQYADFAAWQRDRLAGSALDGQFEYWRRRLDGVVPLELPTDRPRPKVRTTAGALHEFTVPAETAAAVEKLGRAHGTTLFTTLLAACQVWLARYSGQEDVAVGTVTSGRNRPELRPLVGFFVNTVVVRSQVLGSLTFAEFLDEVKTGMLDVFANDEVPFDRLVDLLAPERDPGRTPLIQAMVSLQNAHREPPALPGLRVSEYALPASVASFELTVDFRERDGELAGVVNYNTDLFDEPTIEQMITHLVRLLHLVGERPESRLLDLEFLSEEERRRLLAEWQSHDHEPPTPTLPALFAEQARRTPDATALVSKDGTLTFGELAARAGRLAHWLIGQGVGPERVVALALPHGVDMIVGILGVLEAGAAFLPVDLAQPRDRIAYVLGDAAPALVLATTETAARVPDVSPVRVLDEPGVREAIRAHPGACPTDAHRITPLRRESPAYVIYTSGSTGRPKGVLIEHRSIANLFRSHRDEVFAHAEGRFRVAQATAFSFDASWDSLLWLFAGHELHLVGDDVRRSPELLVDYLDRARIDYVVLTPTYTQQLIAAGLFDPGRHRVAVLSVGGEALGETLWKEICATSGTTGYNYYGPTECTVDAVIHRLDDRAPVIGRPMPGVGAYVLDAALRPVPVGVAGELYLTGVQLARGYVNRPGLTAERFVASPFGTSQRMYRTGDVVRWNAEGLLEYLGRTDDQVKIRGFRIEPGEIETALGAHRGLADVAVVARKDGATHERLVAYVVPSPDAEPPTAAELRGFLGRSLPDYMIPTSFVPLETLPLTSHGKLDRRALPAPGDQARSDRVAPRTPTERTLAGIWADVLGLDQVGVEDNFFEVGGDSILSMRLVARARQAGFALTSKDVFTHQTIARLAVAATRAGAVTQEEEPVGPAPLSPIQHWFFDTHAAGSHRFSMTTTVELAHDVDRTAVLSAVDALVARHDALRTRFEAVDGDLRQVVVPVETAAVCALHDLSALDEESRRAAMEELASAAQSGLDPWHGPVIRAALFDAGAGARPVLLMTVHHLVCDGVSWRILLEDLETAYRQATTGAPIDLGPKTTTPAQWARRLARHARQGRLDAELSYWSGVWRAAPAADLPVDLDGPNTVGSVRTVSAELPAERTDALLRRAPGVYRTQINDLLLSAVGRVLSRWTADDRVLLGMEGHGREELFDGVDLTRTVGWFTAQYPVVLRMPATGGWGETIKSVKEQLRAVPGRGLGYEALRHLTEAGAALRDRPQPPVTVNYHGQFDAAAGGALGLSLARPLGSDQDPDAIRAGLLDLICVVEDGRLRLDLAYSANVHEEGTARRIAAEVVSALDEIVAHCDRPEAGGRTPSDFPLAGLSQPEVDRLVGDGRAVEDVYPLTPMQVGMLFHSLVTPGSGAYHNQLVLRVGGVRRPEDLGAAWQRAVDRTPVLRSSVAWQQVSEPVQVVHRG